MENNNVIKSANMPLVVLVCVFIAALMVLPSCANPDNAGAEQNAEADSVASGSAVSSESAGMDQDAEADSATSGAAANDDAQGQGGGAESLSVSLVGDSVPLGAVMQIKEALPDVEMLVRTDRDLAGPGIELLKQEDAAGKLGDIVVLALGTSNLTARDIENALAVIGADRQCVFVNAYRGGASYIEKVNAAIYEVAAAHADSFTVADWYGYVKAHPDIKLAEDDCHLTESSAAYYAAVIKAGVDEAVGKAK
ncbi:MAG: hypothetical protein LBG82_03820 [Clostridiales Family XIII bacterium]|jgi:hypothetical protein|nr:hypothetical protein [Clostridiales Family XIII bacterium]